MTQHDKPCTADQLRELVRRRTVDEMYWEEAVGPQDAQEALNVCKVLLQDEAHLERILVARKHDETQCLELFLEQVRFRARYRPLDIDPLSISNALPCKFNRA